MHCFKTVSISLYLTTCHGLFLRFSHVEHGTLKGDISGFTSFSERTLASLVAVDAATSVIGVVAVVVVAAVAMGLEFPVVCSSISERVSAVDSPVSLLDAASFSDDEVSACISPRLLRAYHKKIKYSVSQKSSRI